MKGYDFDSLLYVIYFFLALFAAGWVFYAHSHHLFKKWLNEAIEWYIHKEHSIKFIHVDLVEPYIGKRLADMERTINTKRDKEEDDKLEALNLEFHIKESSWKAELARLNKIVDDALAMKTKLVKLYYEVRSRAKELSIITGQNKAEGEEIISNVSSSLGKLETIDMNIGKIVNDIMSNESTEKSTLKIK
jgi:hypothetical protein